MNPSRHHFDHFGRKHKQITPSRIPKSYLDFLLSAMGPMRTMNMLYLGDVLLIETTPFGHTHFLAESGMWLPCGRGTSSRLSKHVIDLLEGQSLSLGDEEVGVDESACAQTTPNPEDVGTEITLVRSDHIRGDDSDDGVPEPVGGGRDGDTTGSDGEREDFTDEHPSTWTPSRGKEEDEDGDEGDLGVDGGDVVCDGATVDDVGVIETLGDTDNGNEELANEHAKSTPYEKWPSSEPLNGPEGDGSRADVDEGEDERDQEGVLDGTSRLEERSRIVEDEVDTSPLLHHLERGSQDRATDVGGTIHREPVKQ